jgi:hypothetical protein
MHRRVQAVHLTQQIITLNAYDKHDCLFQNLVWLSIMLKQDKSIKVSNIQSSLITDMYSIPLSQVHATNDWLAVENNGQASHAEAPGFGEKVFAAQFAHRIDALAEENWPAEHGTHTGILILATPLHCGSRLPCTVYSLPCTVYRVQSTVYSLPCTVYRVQSIVCSLPSTVYSLQSTVYSLPSTVHSLLRRAF